MVDSFVYRGGGERSVANSFVLRGSPPAGGSPNSEFYIQMSAREQIPIDGVEMWACRSSHQTHILTVVARFSDRPTSFNGGCRFAGLSGGQFG